jgi:hypothetical protein
VAWSRNFVAFEPDPAFHWKGTIESRSDTSRIVKSPGDCVMVARDGIPRWLVMRCPCGCGDEIPINLDFRTGPAWSIRNPGPQTSLFPSVWRESGCKSHFILRRGSIWLIRGQPSWRSLGVSEELSAAVLACLTGSPTPYPAVAETLGEDPWDVLDACNLLVKRGYLLEDTQTSGSFYRAMPQA